MTRGNESSASDSIVEIWFNELVEAPDIADGGETLEVGERWKWDGKQDIYLPTLASEINKPIPDTEIRGWLLADENKQRIQDHLSRYFTVKYSGKHFEWFVTQSDSKQSGSKMFTPWDILAVEALSRTVPTETARWLFEPNSKRDELHAESLRSLVPGRDSLWTCDEKLLDEGGALRGLYKLLRKQSGLGYVTASKLLATKFPAVVPIRDSKVETLLGLEKSREWWSPIRKLFVVPDQSLAGYLDELKVPAVVGEVTTLRRLDVILWMEAKARKIETKTRRT